LHKSDQEAAKGEEEVRKAAHRIGRPLQRRGDHSGRGRKIRMLWVSGSIGRATGLQIGQLIF